MSRAKKSKAPVKKAPAPVNPLFSVFFRLTPDGPEVADFGHYFDSDTDQVSFRLGDGSEVVLLGEDANFTEPDEFIEELEARSPLKTIKLAMKLAREITR